MAKRPKYQRQDPPPMKCAFFFERAGITPTLFCEQTEEHRRRAIFYKAENDSAPAVSIADLFEEIKPVEINKRLLSSSAPLGVNAWRKYVASLPAS